MIQFISSLFTFFLISTSNLNAQTVDSSWWKVQSIDTMKNSRDLSREKLHDPAFDTVIDDQIKAISSVHANTVAIATPYDEEFIPILKRWVEAARKYRLHVWFRGNFSGWEGWFDYPKITRVEHLTKISSFIANHPEIFTDGDIFSTCPECENGGEGDPRKTGDIVGFRNFLIDEYTVCTNSFKNIGKNISCNYFSMNADVAKAVMDKVTTAKIGGIVTIDHYVNNPVKLTDDIRAIIQLTGGKVMLGEFGAPIPDIHGDMTNHQQAIWITSAFNQLIDIPELIGVNYWLNRGGTTALWEDNGEAKEATNSISQGFQAQILQGTVLTDYGQPLDKATVKTTRRQSQTNRNGDFTLPYAEKDTLLTVFREGYMTQEIDIKAVLGHPIVKLSPKNMTLWYYIRKLLFQISHK